MEDVEHEEFQRRINAFADALCASVRTLFIDLLASSPRVRCVDRAAGEHVRGCSDRSCACEILNAFAHLCEDATAYVAARDRTQTDAAEVARLGDALRCRRSLLVQALTARPAAARALRPVIAAFANAGVGTCTEACPCVVFSSLTATLAIAERRAMN